MSQVFVRAKQSAATAQIWGSVAYWVLVVGLAVSFGAGMLQTLLAMPDADFIHRVGAVLSLTVPLLPAILFIGALDHLRRALGEYAAGNFFSSSSARSVRRAGEEAVYAMAANAVLVPTILGWVHGSGVFDISFEPLDWALLAFLIFVAAIGRVLDLAAVIKAENDEIV